MGDGPNPCLLLPSKRRQRLARLLAVRGPARAVWRAPGLHPKLLTCPSLWESGELRVDPRAAAAAGWRWRHAAVAVTVSRQILRRTGSGRRLAKPVRVWRRQPLPATLHGYLFPDLRFLRMRWLTDVLGEQFMAAQN
jgi:hypothetical protein